jgi:PKD repeat protein
MNDWLRRHARWLAAWLIVVLAGGMTYVLREAGSASAGPTRAIAQVRAIAPVLAPAAQRHAALLRSRLAVSRSQAVSRPSAAGRPRGIRPGVRTPAPTGRGESLALRQATGLTPAQVTSRPVCPRPAPRHATCAAQALVLRTTGAPVRPHAAAYRALGRVTPALASGAKPAAVAAASPPGPDTPAYLQQAYDLTALAQNSGTGDTVAVVDAYDDPTAASDLATYRSNYGLPPCTTSSGCFRKIGQTGTSSLPAANAAWEQEISLDLDAVSAVCPNCHILLVEANSNTFSDLQAAMSTAAKAKPTPSQISASWWGVSSAVPSGFSTFSGIATVAATGDGGYPGPEQDNYPAALPGVTAAGGTSLAPAAAFGARGFGEGAWSWSGQSGGGSGCDVQFLRPAYQPAMGCDGRAYADVSADADPNTGLMVYNHGTWSLLGGTSLSTPLIAAYYAITGVGDGTPQWAYDDSSALNDLVSGSTGMCAAAINYICNAGTGYDGPTGAGSISGSVVVGAPGIGGPSIASGNTGGIANTYTQAVSAHGATIAGGIYRNGLDTGWSIQYGTTTSYGLQTAPIDVGAGSAPVAVTGYLSQLTPGTTYHYRLVAQNSKGTTVGYDYTLTTQPAPAGAPIAAFAVPSSPAPPGTEVVFDASASTPGTGNSISDYSWNFGDGTGSQDAGTSPTTSHTYAERGTYTVSLTVTSNGQTDTSTQSVTVDDAPTASFIPSASAVPSGATVAFNATASAASQGGSITDYSWSFGDGKSNDAGASTHQSHTFTTPGTYTVTLTTTDDLDVTSTATGQVTVAPFTVSEPIPAPNDNVTFTAVNPPGGSTISWDFGDQTAPGSGSSTTHAYTARGTYTVTLTIQNNGTSTSSTATVIVDPAPTPAFTTSPTIVRPGGTVDFDGSASSTADGGSVEDYSWNFGDGSRAQDASTHATTSHTFATPGIYAITLTTTDDLGTTASSVSQNVTVDEPTAAFTTSQTGTVPNASVSFDATGTSDPESTITHYSWNFGDGNSADGDTAATVTHTYTSPSTYTVTLTVTDALGLTDVTSRQVVVAPDSVQSTGTPPPGQPPVSSPPPAPPTSSPPSGPKPPGPLTIKLTGAGRQRLTTALTHGLRLGLAVNQPVTANFQITVPLAETKQGAHVSHGTRGNPKATVVLLRTRRTLGAGGHPVVLKLSPAAARRLASTGRLVLSVRVTLRTAGGATLTRTAKITLIR